MLQFFIFIFLLLYNSAIIAKSTDISLDLDRVDVRSAIHLIVDLAHLNLVLVDDIEGTVSLHLTRVHWEEALNLLLKTKGLCKQQIGKTLFIAKTADIVGQAKQNYQLREQEQDFAPLITQTIPIHYANTKEILTTLKEKSNGILSSRAHILADEHSHLIWIKDTPKQVREIGALIQQLDKPLRQVMIEARIVNIDRSFEKNLGLRFGFSKPLNEEYSENIHPVKNTLQVNSLPGMEGVAPALGMFVAKLGQGILLDLELTALANEGKGEFISNPKLLTQDQKTAFIQAGEEIPFQERTRSGGTSISFKKAVLSLEVTPKILPNKELLLDLKVNQDSPGVYLSNEVPTINTRQIETHVQVKSGQTVVLGGILESNHRKQANRVPFLSDIPLLGHLFQGNNHAREQRELLVFITPMIV